MEIGTQFPDANSKPAAAAVPSDVEMAIRESYGILDLGEDWDGEGAVPYEPDTLNRAVGFVRLHSVSAAKLGLRLRAPRILPGPDGSIDILWRSGGFELLINFPADPSVSVTFYGDDKRGSVVRGTLSSDTPTVSLLPWLTAP
jgi:hypothetical protein